MSKVIVVTICIAALIPIVLFLLFGETKMEEQPIPISQDELPVASAKEEPREGDSPSCAICRQITEAASQTQCLQDFACEL